MKPKQNQAFNTSHDISKVITRTPFYKVISVSYLLYTVRSKLTGGIHIRIKLQEAQLANFKISKISFFTHEYVNYMKL